MGPVVLFDHMAATKRTPEIEQAIVDSVRLGAFPKHAAEAAGVSRSAYHDWCNDEASDFGVRISRARADALNDGAKIVAGNDDWRARAWWMERMDPEAFGDRSKLELSGTLTMAGLAQIIAGEAQS